MTNHWIDLRNSDVLLVMGANPASNHPISMKWVMKAKERGAKLIVVDPRFTTTATKADLYASLRSGTDIAFLGGMVKYILDNNLYFKEYVEKYTNASFLVNDKYKGPADLNGLFCGFDEKTKKYDKKAWSFQLAADESIKKDPTLRDKNCVFQVLKRHYSRYTLDKVSEICGTSKEKLVEVYKLIGSTGRPDKSMTSLYAMGWTQHTVGVQNIRLMTIVSLLTGNIGVAGGGINALRGESNVQGSTDMGMLFHILPGYMPVPTASQVDLKTYIDKVTPKTKEPKAVNWWQNRPKYITSYLKAIYGKSATAENDFGYAWLPKLNEGMNLSWLNLFDNMFKGKYEGFFAWGQNPACSGANSNKTRAALGKLKWMVNVNLFANETGDFWRGPGMDPAKIQTEVFFLPAASSVEKEGSLANSGRWIQWRYKAIEPIGQSKPDGEIIHELQHKVKELYKKDPKAKFPAPIVNLTWDYTEKGKEKEVNVHRVAKEINGYYLEDVFDKKQTPPKLLGEKGRLAQTFVHLQADGTTSCGNWVMSQSYPELPDKEKDGTPKVGKNGRPIYKPPVNNLARRGKDDPTGLGLYPQFAWTWPVNRRIIYNRASVNTKGQPWNPARPLLKWDPIKEDPATKKPGVWVGDVPDNAAPPLSDEKAGRLPFIMTTSGVGNIFGPGLNDGPLPEHYEPLECPIEANPLSKQRTNPTIKIFSEKEDAFFSCDTRFPFVATTYRVTEHWQTGLMTRNTPWLLEMQPQQFCEMSRELAQEKGIQSGDNLKITSARGTINAVAIVTGRWRPFKIANTTVHEIGLPWCYGWRFPEKYQGGDSSNLLTPTVGDPNTMIPESKAFMVNVEKA